MSSNRAELEDAAQARCLKASDLFFENCPEQLVVLFSNAISLNFFFFVWRNIFNSFLNILEKHVKQIAGYIMIVLLQHYKRKVPPYKHTLNRHSAIHGH